VSEKLRKPAEVAVPLARGLRIEWHDVPQRIREEIQTRVGSEIVEARTQPEGFSPALVARLRMADSRRVFVKAVPGNVNPDSPDIYRREVDIVSRLPHDLPVPRLLWSFDEGPGGWVVLCFDDVEGRHPVLPWNEEELNVVMTAVDDLLLRLTPAPFETGRAGDHIAAWAGWRRLRERPIDGVDAWALSHLDDLAALEKASLEAARGTSLVHLDIRGDNLLLADGQVWFVDWPWACLGAAWVDPLFFAFSVETQGGPPAGDVFARSRWSRGVDEAAIAAALCAVAGMLVHHSLLPPPPGLPTLRPFQAAQGRIAVRWLRELMD
jgi:Phosphotransferase enzyme family